MLNYQTGWIEVICGSMFSGKTEELIRRIRRATIARQRVILFKPEIDNRYSENLVVSHSQQKIDAEVARNTKDIVEKSRGYEVVGIDEAQFFGLPLVQTCQALADEGKRVIISGLDQDYQGEPFEPIPQLLAIAEYITKNLAICMRCGNPANRNQRLSKHTQRVMLGGQDSYEARCRRCHEINPSNLSKESSLDKSMEDDDQETAIHAVD